LLAAEIAVLDLAPLLACGDPDQGLVELFLERTSRRQRDRHIRGLENALRGPDGAFEAHRDHILERADAVDDRVDFTATKRGESGGL
jgi:hypothetical protein